MQVLTQKAGAAVCDQECFTGLDLFMTLCTSCLVTRLRRPCNVRSYRIEVVLLSKISITCTQQVPWKTLPFSHPLNARKCFLYEERPFSHPECKDIFQHIRANEAARVSGPKSVRKAGRTGVTHGLKVRRLSPVQDATLPRLVSAI